MTVEIQNYGYAGMVMCYTRMAGAVKYDLSDSIEQRGDAERVATAIANIGHGLIAYAEILLQDNTERAKVTDYNKNHTDYYDLMGLKEHIGEAIAQILNRAAIVGETALRLTETMWCHWKRLDETAPCEQVINLMEVTWQWLAQTT